MKVLSRIIFSIGIIAIITGLAIGCRKTENTISSNEQTMLSKSIPSQVLIGYSVNDTTNIIFAGNKDSLIAELEPRIQATYGSYMIVEDVEAYHLDTIEVLKVTLFDTQKGGTYTTFAKLDRVSNSSKAVPGIYGYCYYLRIEIIYESITCYSENCGNGGCEAVNTVKGLTCTACPSGNCSWIHTMGRYVMEYTFMAVWTKW